MLVHCAAGKDRTGVVVALALAAVGVQREAIVADYVLTGERIGEIMARLRASETYRADLEPYTDESRKPHAEILERVLEVLDEEHGGPLGWLAAHGFDPAPLRAAYGNLNGLAVRSRLAQTPRWAFASKRTARPVTGVRRARRRGTASPCRRRA